MPEEYWPLASDTKDIASNFKLERYKYILQQIHFLNENRVLRAFGDRGMPSRKGGIPLATTASQGLRCEQEPPAQEVDLGPPKHGPLQHLQAIDLAFDGAVTPTQREACFHRLIVSPQPSGKAL